MHNMITQRPLNELLNVVGHCEPDSYCQYHSKKRNNLALMLPPFFPASDVGPFAKIQPREELVSAVRKMDDDFRLAGSWQLMGEQREWFLRRVAAGAIRSARRIAFAILGIPGVTHLVETEKLIRAAAGSNTHIDFYVMERCIRPLIDISDNLFDKGFRRFGPAPGITSTPPLISLKSNNTSFQLLHCDVAQGLPLATRSIDIISSHLLFSFLSSEGSSTVLKEVARSLKDGGKFIAAQEPVDFMHVGIKAYFERSGLQTDDFSRSWNIYALSSEQRSCILQRREVTVENDTFLLDLRA